MRSIFLAITILITTIASCFLTIAVLNKKTNKRQINSRFSYSYNSVCHISTGSSAGSGVMLKSGYILTAAHVVDRNHNGKIERKEKKVSINFPTISFKTNGTVIATSRTRAHLDLDLAIVVLDKKPQIVGVDLMHDYSYSKLRIGDMAHIVGMMNNFIPASITEGRLTDFSDENSHRVNGTVYYGNSGGGIFNKRQELIGIVTKVGVGHSQHITVPIFEERMIVGTVRVRSPHPLANVGLYVPSTAVRGFLKKQGLESKVLPKEFQKKPPELKHPMKKYFYFLGFNFINFILLMAVSKKLYKPTKA